MNACVRRTLGVVAVLVAVAGIALIGGTSSPPSAQAQSFQRISGEGSSWSANAIDAMRVNVRQFGITVDYNPSGSTAGRRNFLNGTVDFAASDIPFQFEPEDGSAPENPAPDSYAYIPVTAGGTAFMYNLRINGQPVTNLRLSGENVARIFTGAITQWNDPAIQEDNPGLVMPARQIVPVVRSDGSGSTAQFTRWMIDRHAGIWNDYCNRSGRAPACGETSFYPTISGMIAQAGDLGVSGYVQQGFAEGAIGYVNYSYALGAQFPVAKVLNAAGYYTEPTPENVAVSLLQARIIDDPDNLALHLTQDLDGVYSDTDPRNYQLSSYSYFILPTAIQGQFNEAKGRTLGEFAYYAMCQAQNQSASLGYSPIPINLVQAAFDQIRFIPGVEAQSINVQDCNNPTFSADGTNVLARNAPQPQECDRRGPLHCPDGTAGLASVPTAVVASALGGGGGGGGNGGGGGGDAGNGDSGSAAQGGDGGAGGGAPDAPAAGQDPAASGSGVSPSGGGGEPSATQAGQAAGGSDDAAAGSGTDSSTSADESSAANDPTADAASQAATTGGAASGELIVDPDTGQVVGGQPGQAQAAGAAAAGPATTTLDQESGWGSTQTLALVVALLTLGLIVGPALAWRSLSQNREDQGPVAT